MKSGTLTVIIVIVQELYVLNVWSRIFHDDAGVTDVINDYLFLLKQRQSDPVDELTNKVGQMTSLQNLLGNWSRAV